MTIALESELVGSRYDQTRQTCHYTIKRDGKHWTATILLSDLNRIKDKQARRNFVANALMVAMQGEPDV